jgi:DNA-binding transcriptional LysR family regulator
LRPLLPDFSVLPVETPIHALFPRERSLAPKVRAFVDFLAEELAEG